MTVDQFVRRYHVDQVQSQRVCSLAREFHRQLEPVRDEKGASAEKAHWAARLHEIGISISQGAYHKHSAYILANADMPGFLAAGAGVAVEPGPRAARAPVEDARGLHDASLAMLALCLRLAVIFYRSRRTLKLPRLRLARKAKGWRLEVEATGSPRTRSSPSPWMRSAASGTPWGRGFEAVEGP